ncbi:3-oxoacid CoA-transferase subunit A [Bacillus sp. B15-48]|uniref:3-oxoacid CoA-transferase subunit A n=1 Tax=Bacillus sp. B15-48 TaxID=1548601 RepID=UPI00193F9CED|nr:3-oxoacid CoA-transferase subunit A [Bacillus sp. B15-48]MBM4763349.1 3-oxoacid CoA-transferase subunit A [Bacillus sp. B15-48]
MINKIFNSVEDAVKDIKNDSTIMFGGFGGAGVPDELLEALYQQGATNITAVSNNCGYHDVGLAKLIKEERIKKIICSFPLMKESYNFVEKYKEGKIELELVPQGTLAERIRAGGSGIEAFYTPTGVGTEVAAGKVVQEFDGIPCVLEKAIKADYAIIRAKKADRWGNLVYNKSGRSFNPIMAMASKVTIVEVDEIVELGELDPEVIVTPGIFVNRIVKKGGL